MTESFSCSGVAAGQFTTARLDLVASALGDHSVPFDRHSTTLRGISEHGHFDIVQDGEDFCVTLTASATPLLFALHGQILHIMEHGDPELVRQLAWSGTLPDQGPPVNFRLANVVEVTRPFANFCRVTLRIENVAYFTDGGMHFRLLLPPAGRTPVWPHVDETGRTRFPTGEDVLHNPVYTFVAMDVAANQFTFDVFIHAGGRITEWVLAAQIGDTIGMMGPGGGQMPDARQIVLVGDETALPAIRRILAIAGPMTTGRALIEVQSSEDIQQLAHPKGVDVTWVMRGIDPCPVETILSDYADATPQTAPFLWCGAEKSKVQRARKHFRDACGITADQSYFSGYWRKSQA
jgi:NADPH-dependent ferric siderophore reductase